MKVERAAMRWSRPFQRAALRLACSAGPPAPLPTYGKLRLQRAFVIFHSHLRPSSGAQKLGHLSASGTRRSTRCNTGRGLQAQHARGLQGTCELAATRARAGRQP